MKTSAFTLIIIATAGPLHAGLISLGEHVDIRWRWESPATWTCQAVTDSNGEIARATQDVFFPLSDKAYSAVTPSTSGARNIQPVSAAYAFTGVAPGQPLWIAVQGTPGIGEGWPGFENNQAAGTLGSYLETDPRLPQPQTISREWISVCLKSVTYQGSGASPTVSLWTVSGGAPRVWMATADGLGAQDRYLYAVGTHNHLNWGFGAQGIYRLQIAATAYKGPGKTNPTAESASHTLTFAVGPVANWQATYFAAIELENPAVCGMDADPDGDGMTNLQEFAFGFDPRNGSALPVAIGLGLPTISLVEESGTFYEVLEYPRRRAGEQIAPLVYSPEFSTGLDPGSWQSESVITTTADFPAEINALNPVWEMATSRRPLETGTPARGFARLGLQTGE